MAERLLHVLALLVVVCMCGCSAVPEGIHMSDYADVKAGNMDIRADRFGAGDVPTVVITDCGGRNCTVRIRDLSTGNVVKTYREYVPEGWTRWWWFKDLPAGSYKAELIVQGDVMATTTFTVEQ